MKTILCFGDSNTWGYDPLTSQRYPRGVRWTSRLQAALPGYCILEEGLGGRTTVFDDDLRSGRRGLTHLPVALKTHDPIDLVLLMLGTNDCKNRFRAHAAEITEGMQALIELVQSPALLHLRHAPAVLLIAPPPIDAEALSRGGMRFMFNAESVQTSYQLSAFYRELACRMNVHFFDAGKVTGPGADGIHLSAEGHATLASALAQFLPGVLDG